MSRATKTSLRRAQLLLSSQDLPKYQKIFGDYNGRVLYALHLGLKHFNGSFSEKLEFMDEIIELNK